MTDYSCCGRFINGTSRILPNCKWRTKYRLVKITDPEAMSMVE